MRRRHALVLFLLSVRGASSSVSRKEFSSLCCLFLYTTRTFFFKKISLSLSPLSLRPLEFFFVEREFARREGDKTEISLAHPTHARLCCLSCV